MAKSVNNKEKCSIKDVAEIAQVSTATVSRVVNGKGYVSSETEKRVRAAIAQCSFVPNMAARGLRTNRMPIIGFVVDNVKNEYFSDLATHLQKFFLKHGYFVIITTTDSVPDIERASIEMLIEQKVSGLVILSRDQGFSSIPKDIPTVYIDCLPAEDASEMTVRIESDNRTGAYIATNELIEKGCQNIVLFTGPEDAYTSRMRTEGYFAALIEAGISIDLRYVFHFENFDYANGEDLVDQLYASNLEFDGIFCICDYVVLGALDALRKRNIKVPEEVKVVGFDDLFLAQTNGKKLTTIHQCSQSVAQYTTNALLEMIGGAFPVKNEIMVPTYIVRRETT